MSYRSLKGQDVSKRLLLKSCNKSRTNGATKEEELYLDDKNDSKVSPIQSKASFWVRYQLQLREKSGFDGGQRQYDFSESVEDIKGCILEGMRTASKSHTANLVLPRFGKRCLFLKNTD